MPAHILLYSQEICFFLPLGWVCCCRSIEGVAYVFNRLCSGSHLYPAGGNDDVTSSVALADTPTGEGNRMLQQVHRAAHRTSMANQKSSPCQFKVVSV